MNEKVINTGLEKKNMQNNLCIEIKPSTMVLRNKQMTPSIERKPLQRVQTNSGKRLLKNVRYLTPI